MIWVSILGCLKFEYQLKHMKTYEYLLSRLSVQCACVQFSMAARCLLVLPRLTEEGRGSFIVAYRFLVLSSSSILY